MTDRELPLQASPAERTALPSSVPNTKLPPAHPQSYLVPIIQIIMISLGVGQNDTDRKNPT